MGEQSREAVSLPPHGERRRAIVTATPLLEGTVDAIGVEAFFGTRLSGIECVPSSDLLGEGLKPGCGIGDVPGIEACRVASRFLLAS